jgi:transcriptional regulator with XRE-family HTH domain
MDAAETRRRSALAEFLRMRRARLTPAEVGLPVSSRRRTPGLRREEVAYLANMGIAWYTALEQKRDIHPSSSVLDSLADALRLTVDERRHLFVLAGRPLPIQSAPDDEMVSPAVRRLIDDLDPDPAAVLGRCWDYLYWNQGASAVFNFTDAPPPYPCNFVWNLFTRPTARREGWESVARIVLAQFRADSAHYPDHPRFTALIGDLERTSPEFRAWWPLHDVHGTLDCRKELNHPIVGLLVLDRTTLQLPAMPSLKILVYTPVAETDTAHKLHLLVAQCRTSADTPPGGDLERW